MKARAFCRVEAGSDFSYMDVIKCFQDKKIYGIRGKEYLKEILIPANVEILCEGCFSSCSSLSSVRFIAGSCLKCIESHAFYGCKNLRDIEIPAGVELLCGSCFSGCDSLNSVRFAEGSCLKRIESYAFRECKSLREIEIPAGVEVCNGAFSCTCITGIRRDGTAYIVADRSNLRDIEIPATVEVVGNHRELRIW